MQPEGVCYFCPDCARIWASILVAQRPARVISVPCLKHHRSFYWPGGTIWLSWENEMMAALPHEALVAETKRWLELAEELT